MNEVGQRWQSLEEPIERARVLVDRIRGVAKQAEYCMLITDKDGAAVTEYCDSPMARQLKDQGIAVGTLWDESCVGTNGVGTALATENAITVNGVEHFHKSLHRFMCSAAPLIDHRGVQYGALNFTTTATDDAAEIRRVDAYVRRAAKELHTYTFRTFFREHRLVAITDSLFKEEHEMSRLLALDEGGRLVGVTNELLAFLGGERRQALIGLPLDEIIGLDSETVLSEDGRLHRLECIEQGSAYAVGVTPAVKTARLGVGRGRSGVEPSVSELELEALAGGDDRLGRTVALCRRLLEKRAQGADIPLLLQGETGTGKDTFARALHAASRRHAKSFVELNCAAIPETLIDSELFGYAPGTFTGGLKGGKAGRIVAANDGTLFLDEIGDMPLESQTRLLRVLAEREVHPLGAARSVPVDFRLVCASHRDLMDLVRAGRFREDLYYRVCGAKLTLPPLRERQDLDDLVAALHVEFDPDTDVQLSTDVRNVFRRYPWPGNIRQLRNVIQYVVFSRGAGIATLDDLPEDLLTERADKPSSALLHITPSADVASIDPGTEAIPVVGRSRRDELLEALRQSSWCVSDAARRIGVSRATVHRHMKKHGLVRPDTRHGIV